MSLLEQIEKPNDIKQIRKEDREALAKEIRQFLIHSISKTGGHLASNLGTVELTMALHLMLDFPEDKLVWDVGHQAYTHKILTERRDGFSSLRQFGGMSGFPKQKESNCDAFDTGHSSTSISAALGLARARDIKGLAHKVYAVIGDGALSGGMAYEALNNAARMKTNMVIVLNDNNMSITENVGGMANYLGKIRTATSYQNLKGGVESALRSVPMVGDAVADKIKRSKDSLKRLFIPGMLFEDMGLTYIGPIDGHNISEMIVAFQSAQRAKGAVLVHVITKKGKGYSYAEKIPSKYHGIDPFDIKSGKSVERKKAETYTSVFGSTLLKEAKENPSLVAVCAAMSSGTGLMDFRREYPSRYFDVGIAEEHAVTFAGGLAAGGLHPVVAIYSTFLQRAYDQLIHDVCLSNLPVTFAIDRAGLVGEDGETHQGVFDLAYLSNIPNMVVLAPKNKQELEAMLCWSFSYMGPSAVRYPRGSAYQGLLEYQDPIVLKKSECLHKGSKIALLAVGAMNETAVNVREVLVERGYNPSHINVRFIKPMDTDILDELSTDHTIFVTMEEGVRLGGYGQMVSDYFMEAHAKKNLSVVNISIPDCYVEHGKVDCLKEKIGVDTASILERIMKLL
ncbi:MAG: 1-deoxy-D-xylulose-5-phosphate synthase [Clostridiales bacterium]|nr:1-deoxy-D-xylulose-5-phosphate synthase [Clostridiales bacterium]